MTEGTNGYSLSDIAAMVGNRGGSDSFLNGNGILIILFFLIMMGGFGGGFGGWGNNSALQNALTRSDLTQVAYEQSAAAKLDSFSNEVNNDFHSLENGVNAGFASIAQAINDSRFASQTCCCETNRNIDSLKYENALNTSAITNAIANEGQATRALITANTVQALRDKLVEKDQELQTANFAISQAAQNATLINALRPTPNPAYLTCSPYQSTQAAYAMLNGGLYY